MWGWRERTFCWSTAQRFMSCSDLNIGRCRMCVAAKNGFRDDPERTLRVATEFPHITRTYYTARSRDIDIIRLHGSIEIAPILDLTDVIVDIVETGTTLRENDLTPIETIVPISARLIANKVSFQFKHKAIQTLYEGLKEQVASPREGGRGDMIRILKEAETNRGEIFAREDPVGLGGGTGPGHSGPGESPGGRGAEGVYQGV